MSKAAQIEDELQLLLCRANIPDTFISKTTRLYKDSRSLTNGQQQGATQLDQLNENLKDVTRIMTKNMEDLLWRGDSLDRE